MTAPYNKAFYVGQIDGSRTAAEIILPLVWECAGPFAGVADVGCGTGCWLDVARGLGAERIMGFDGNWASESLVIPQECFRSCDLNKPIVPLFIWAGMRKFDLVMSLETAEHLEPESSERHVDDLVSLADVVLFSAAIPGQGGTGHVNEQWTAYWVKLFAERGYEAFDAIRPKIWEDQRIPVWYRQNTLLFVNSLADCWLKLHLTREYEGPIMTIVHPELYMSRSAFFR